MLSAIDSNGNVTVSPYSKFNGYSQSQPGTSHHSSSSKPLFPSLNSSRKKPVQVPTEVDEEDDWFSRRWRGSDKQSEPKGDTGSTSRSHEKDRPRRWETSTRSGSSNHRPDREDIEPSRSRSSGNGVARRKNDYASEESDRKERQNSSHSHSRSHSERHSRRDSSKPPKRKRFEEEDPHKLVLRSRKFEKRDVDNPEQRYNGGYY